jgi:hypothetical protein
MYMEQHANARLREFASSAGAHPSEGGTAPCAMAANPKLGMRGNRAHTQATVLGQLKKNPAEPRCSLRESSDHRETICGRAEFAESAHRVPGFMPARSHQPEFLD